MQASWQKETAFKPIWQFNDSQKDFEKLTLFSTLLKQNIYCVGAREYSKTSNICSIPGPLNVAEVNIELDNQQTHKICQPIQNDMKYENTNNKKSNRQLFI